jgi:hypothetical protein
MRRANSASYEGTHNFLEKQNPSMMMNKAMASRAQISLDWTMNDETLVRDSASCLGDKGK